MRSTLVPLLGLTALLAGGCRHDPLRFGAEHVVPASQRPTLFGLSQRDRFGLADMGAGAMGGATGADTGEFTADAPAGWEAMPRTELRHLNYRVAGNPDAECYLTVGVGGGVLANVNRWVSKQFGQPPLSASEFAALPRQPLLGQSAALVQVEGSFTGMGATARDGFELLGLVAGTDDAMVTLKFIGPKAVVEAQRAAFLAFAASVRPAVAAMSTKTAAGSGAPHAPLPTGWEEVAPTDMRQLNYRIAGSPEAECYLTTGVGGGLLGNANRWISQQFGKAPLTEAEFAALPRHPLLGQPAALVTVEGSFAGMAAGKRDGFALLGLIGGTDSEVTTLKLVGPKAVVEAQRAAFLQLAASIERGGSSAAAGQVGPPLPPPLTGPPASVPPVGHGGATDESPPFAATIGKGWTALGDTGSRMLRHRFGQQGECYVGQLGGDLAAMVGIWCGEMSATAPGDAAAIAALPKVTMLGGEGVLLDLSGNYQSMGGQTLAGARSLVAAVQQNGAITFAKCLGPAAEVEAARPAFLEFVRTLRRTGP